MPPLRRRRQLRALLVAPCLAAVRTSSTIMVYNQNRTTVPTHFKDEPADAGFGPRVPDEGFAGRLQRAAPDRYACTPLNSPIESSGARPISLETNPPPPSGGRGGRLVTKDTVVPNDSKSVST
ncbi:unnamed protein product, partial [Laminaria digitata]